MATLVDLVEVDEVGIRLLSPAPRRLVELSGKDADGCRNGDTLDVEEAELVLPVETSRRDARVREPGQRDVVEDLVSREAADGVALKGVRDVVVTARVIHAASATGESASPYSVCGRNAISVAYPIPFV